MKLVALGLILVVVPRSVIASPTPRPWSVHRRGAASAAQPAESVQRRDTAPPEIIINTILAGSKLDNTNGAATYAALLNAFKAAVATNAGPAPTSISDATSSNEFNLESESLATNYVIELASIFTDTSKNIYISGLQLIINGFGSTLSGEINTITTGAFSGQNSINNNNPRNPNPVAFPQRGCTDAPYSLSEAQLRQAIYIPSSFTYGQKIPVILVPGSALTGYQSFDGNYIPLLQKSSFADPVWLNVPNQLLADTQVNAEYVAYAINYINGITSKNVSVVTFSQGGLITQWAFKYWPSTRKVVSNFLPQSADFHGTVEANGLCQSFPTLPCAPALVQQTYNSKFVTALRANGGDSAYVPTTSLFSATDEVVQPQNPIAGASSYLNDARGVGVSNVQVQAVCGGNGPAGTLVTHEGMLYNPLSWALTVDALTKGGPGQLNRLDISTVCSTYTAPGLDVGNLLITEETVPIAIVSAITYSNKVSSEPPLMSYANSNPTVCTR